VNSCCTFIDKQAGNHVKDDVWHALIVVISNAPELQGYSVRSLYTALQAYNEQVWVLILLFIMDAIPFHPS
jgi:hypothetical protein